MKEELIFFIICALPSCVLCAMITKFIIPKLKSLKLGQKILDIGPRWHKGKEGTPTMGGIAMMAASLPVLVGATVYIGTQFGWNATVKIAIGYVTALLYGFIGLLDDSVKMLKKQNEGLTPIQKYLLQLVIAAAFLFAMTKWGELDTTLKIPFTTVEWNMGAFYYVFAVLLITGVVNAVNLTDGIDGLASSVTLVVGGFFAVAASGMGYGEAMPELALSATVVGITLGFLVYNAYPAKIFMGDTGSLFLGGLVVELAFMINSPLIIVVCGAVYILEALSVILQVGCYKLTKKRIFKMAPIHHHFEMCEWSEVKIVIVFTLTTALASAVAYFGL